MSKYVCFYVQGQPNSVFEADIIKGKTSTQLAEITDSKNKILFIKTPRFIKELPYNCEPLNLFPELLLSERPDGYVDAPYMLMFVEKSEAKFIKIKVTPDTEQIKVPPFYATIDTSLISEMNAFELLEIITKEVGLPISEQSLVINEIPVDMNQSASTVIEKAQHFDLILKFTPTPEFITKSKKRVNIVREIIETEQTYLKDLNTIANFWQTNCATKIKMEQSDLDQIFKNIGPILNCHTTFLEDLKKCGTEYSSCFASTFLKFAPLFKFSQMYISNYPQIQNVVANYESKSKNQKIFKQLQRECDERDFQSYLITPVQRMPRYTLFLKELVKSTPTSHPDYNYIKIASEQIDAISKQIDQSSTNAKLKQRLFELQQKIKEDFTFLDRQRQLLMEVPIKVIERSNVTGTIFFFDDILMFIKNGSKGQRIIFDAPVTKFPFIPGKPNATSITIDSTGKEYAKRMIRDHHEYQIEFETPENYDKFFAEYEKQLTMLILKSNTKYGFKWICNKASPEYPELGPHFALRVSGRIYVFSGKGFNNIQFLSIKNDFAAKQVDPNECPLPPLKQPRSVTIGHSICIISDKFLYIIDPHTHNVEERPITGIYTPRIGQSLVYHGKYLYVFGGESGQNKFDNDLIMIDPNSGASELISVQNGPSARAYHASVVVGDKMFVIGGSNQSTTFNDIYYFDLNNRVWESYPSKLTASKNDFIFTVGPYIILLSLAGQIQLFDTGNGEVLSIENFGNCVQNLQGYGAIQTKSNDVVLLTSPRDKVVYSIEFPEMLKGLSGSRHSRMDSMEFTKPAKQRGKHFKEGPSKPSRIKPKHFGQTDIDLSEAADHVIKIQSPLRSPSSSIFDITPNPDRQIDMDVPAESVARALDFNEEEEETVKTTEMPQLENPSTDSDFPPSSVEIVETITPPNEAKDQALDEEPHHAADVPAITSEDVTQPKEKSSIVVPIAIGLSVAAAIGAVAFFAYRKFARRN